MTDRITTNWQGDMCFSSEINGHTIKIDANEQAGGKNLGPRPKPLMLLALAGCTGMDVISILRKMRVIPKDFKIDVSGELTDTHPKQYKSMHITYIFKGTDLDVKKIEKAISLSQNNYCGVSALYAKAINVTHEIKIITTD